MLTSLDMMFYTHSSLSTRTMLDSKNSRDRSKSSINNSGRSRIVERGGGGGGFEAEVKQSSLFFYFFIKTKPSKRQGGGGRRPTRPQLYPPLNTDCITILGIKIIMLFIINTCITGPQPLRKSSVCNFIAQSIIYYVRTLL